MRKVGNILNNIKKSNQKEHFYSQMKINSSEIIKENEYFYKFDKLDKYIIYIYRNFKDDAPSNYNLLFQLINNVSGIVFYELNSNTISIFIHPTLSTNSDEICDGIKERLIEKEWFNKDIEVDVNLLIDSLEEENIKDLIEKYINQYPEEYLSGIFERNIVLPCIDDSRY